LNYQSIFEPCLHYDSMLNAANRRVATLHACGLGAVVLAIEDGDPCGRRRYHRNGNNNGQHDRPSTSPTTIYRH
jgi:hypothetical protein